MMVMGYNERFMIKALIAQRRFLPLFCTQFLGAFNDNLFKNALVILLTYALVTDAKDAQSLVALAGGIFILPFFLFSAVAGQVADRFEKSRLIRLIKLAEIVIMMSAGIGLILGNTYLLFLTLFLLGTQSTFFGPIKYAILPIHLEKTELIAGNALIEASTFISILLGTIVGGVVIVLNGGVYWITTIGLLVAIVGLVSSFFIPSTPVAAPDLKISKNILASTWRIIGFAREERRVFLSILGISWFWLMGAAFLAQFPGLSKDIIGAHEYVVTLFLCLFSLGIALGTFISNRVQKGEVNATYVPLALIGMSVFIGDLFLATHHILPSSTTIQLREFIATPANWRIMFDIFMISACGGVYVVPLYALVQLLSDKHKRSRIIAANNILNALFMTVSAIILTVLLQTKMKLPQVFLLMSILNFAVALYICRLLPDAVVKSLVRCCLKFLYQVEVIGLNNYPKEKGNAIVVANHVSLLDGVLLAAFLPENYLFAIDKRTANTWWIKPFISLMDAFPVDPSNPMSLKALIHKVRRGRSCIIFPEGRLTKTGALMKVYEGPGLIADKTQNQIVPVRIEGAQFTPFTRLRGKVRVRWCPKISLSILAPTTLHTDENLTGRQRRHAIGIELYDLMTDLIYSSSDIEQSLFASLLDARHCHGKRHIIAEDINRQPMDYANFILRASVLSQKLKTHCLPGEFVGLMLPNSLAGMVTFFAMQQQNIVPAMLNYSAGERAIRLACEMACCRTVVTSKKFIQLAKLEHIIVALEEKKVNILFLEDLSEEINATQKINGWWHAKKPHALWKRTLRKTQPIHPAVILFTSGSEGTPKGVILSHRNIQANRFQLASKIDFNAQDIIFNAMPTFHSFGLTVGTLLPILSGVKTFLYPSPLHYRVIPELVYDLDATILFGTDSFLQSYAQSAHPYDFYSLRYIFAGAEKLKAATRKTYQEKFGVRIFEGYGTTETSPALAINTPMHYKSESVGRLLPQVSYKLEPVDGISEGGRLWVKGDNVMLGYLKIGKPGVCQALEDGWYDTGDIVDVDEEGFVTIIGRAKRFAKISGEMISLSSVESEIHEFEPEFHHAVVSVADAHRGEALVLVTDASDLSRESLLKHFKSRGYPEMYCPKVIKCVSAMPLLGNGKIDYPVLTEIINT